MCAQKCAATSRNSLRFFASFCALFILRASFFLLVLVLIFFLVLKPNLNFTKNSLSYPLRNRSSNDGRIALGKTFITKKIIRIKTKIRTKTKFKSKKKCTIRIEELKMVAMVRLELTTSEL